MPNIVCLRTNEAVICSEYGAFEHWNIEMALRGSQQQLIRHITLNSQQNWIWNWDTRKKYKVTWGVCFAEHLAMMKALTWKQMKIYFLQHFKRLKKKINVGWRDWQLYWGLTESSQIFWQYTCTDFAFLLLTGCSKQDWCLRALIVHRVRDPTCLYSFPAEELTQRLSRAWSLAALDSHHFLSEWKFYIWERRKRERKERKNKKIMMKWPEWFEWVCCHSFHFLFALKCWLSHIAVVEKQQ